MRNRYDNTNTDVSNGLRFFLVLYRDNLAEVKRRLELLENSQRPTVDSSKLLLLARRGLWII